MMNYKIKPWATLAALALITLAVCASAQDPAAVLPPEPSPSGDAVASFLGNLVAKYPWLALVISILGGARLWLKPLFSFLHAFVQSTPTTKDDEWLAKAETSKVFKAVNWVADYVFSIKLIHPKTEVKK